MNMTVFLMNSSISYLLQQLKMVALRRLLSVKYIKFLFHSVAVFFLLNCIFHFLIRFWYFFVLIWFYLINERMGTETLSCFVLSFTSLWHLSLNDVISVTKVSDDTDMYFILNCFLFQQYNHSEFYPFLSVITMSFHFDFCKSTFEYPKHQLFQTSLIFSFSININILAYVVLPVLNNQNVYVLCRRKMKG